MQPSPVGKHLVGVSEAGNILIYDAAALGQELRQVSEYLCQFLFLLPAPLVKYVTGYENLEQSFWYQIKAEECNGVWIRSYGLKLFLVEVTPTPIHFLCNM